MLISDIVEGLRLHGADVQADRLWPAYPGVNANDARAAYVDGGRFQRWIEADRDAAEKCEAWIFIELAVAGEIMGDPFPDYLRPCGKHIRHLHWDEGVCQVQVIDYGLPPRNWVHRQPELFVVPMSGPPPTWPWEVM